MSTYKSVIVLTPNARRQTIKVTPNTSLLQVLEEASAKHGYNSKEFDLKHHSKIMDLSNVIRFTGLPNNALLEMVPAVKVRQDSEVFIGIQIESGERFTGTFMPSDSLWTLLSQLCPVEVSKDGNPVAIYMRTEVSGKENLEKTTLHSLGITGGRAMLRFIHRSPEELKIQANVSAPLVRPSAKPKIESPAIDNKELESSNKDNISVRISQQEVTSKKEDLEKDKATSSLSEMKELKDRSPLHEKKIAEKHIEADAFEPMEEDKNICREECREQIDEGSKMKVEEIERDKEEPMDVTDSKMHGLDSNKSKPVHSTSDVTELEEEIKFLPGEHNGCAFSLNDSQPMSAKVFAKDLPDEFFEVTVEDARILMRDLTKRRSELEDAPLMTSGLRYQQEMNKLAMPCVIRVMFPDRVVLQGCFIGGNTVEDVKDFVVEQIKYSHLPFILYTSPPKVILNPESLLYLLDGFPTMLVYFAFDEGKCPEEEAWKTVADSKNHLKDDVMNNLTSQTCATRAALKSRGIQLNSSYSQLASTSKQPSTSKHEINKELLNNTRNVQSSAAVSQTTNQKIPKWFRANK
ncbi:hypothetical protein J437_LFUL004364 [Ladona fulva]|uniref:TUG ubiquitin-like domain-containing protein n=1 Tax=Ladona fulva TaxID=123851 RepID=A0A8K0K992_LADFU|nr:hypothetical protein J437_LFUL004364 [Ladona fulva]